jgi:hypothetical protein
MERYRSLPFDCIGKGNAVIAAHTVYPGVPENPGQAPSAVRLAKPAIVIQ